MEHKVQCPEEVPEDSSTEMAGPGACEEGFPLGQLSHSHA
jgi:hypothetical protein